MKKLRLNLDTLRVESFSTQPAADRRSGTVRGHSQHDPTHHAGCTWAGCDGSSGCVSGPTGGPPPSFYSCDSTCQHEN